MHFLIFTRKHSSGEKTESLRIAVYPDPCPTCYNAVSSILHSFNHHHRCRTQRCLERKKSLCWWTLPNKSWQKKGIPKLIYLRCRCEQKYKKPTGLLWKKKKKDAIWTRWDTAKGKQWVTCKHCRGSRTQTGFTPFLRPRIKSSWALQWNLLVQWSLEPGSKIYLNTQTFAWKFGKKCARSSVHDL